MMWNWDGGWGWGSWAGMGVMMLLVTGVVVGLVVWAALWATRSTTSHRSLETPRAVLDRRLAAGEIDADEYAAARRLIEEQTTQAG